MFALAQEGAVEAVTVTGKFQNSVANRLPIAPVDLPFSLDVIDRSVIEQRAFLNPLDILETLPNVVRRQTQLLPTGGSYNIRGLYATVLTNNRPENDSRGAGRRDTSQIESIEVIKGPASILTGPVIPGGVINQVTKSPQSDDFLRVSGRAGSFGTYRFEADGNMGAILGSSVFSGRMTLAVEEQGSAQKPEEAKTFSVRPVIEANFTDRTRAQASIAYTSRKAAPASTYPANSDGTMPSVFDETTYLGIPGKLRGEDTYVDAEFQHEFLDNLKLVARGSYQASDFDYRNSQTAENYIGLRGFQPGDTIAGVNYSMGYRDTTVEYGDVQLVGGFDALGRHHDIVVGATRQKTTFNSYYAYGGLLGNANINNLGAATYVTPNFNLVLNPFSRTSNVLSSYYAEATLRPVDRLTIVAGVRHDDFEVTNRVTRAKTPTDDVTFRVGGSFELLDGFNAYASYAESFIPQTGLMRNGSVIDPETATNYEIGVKGGLLDNRLNLTAAMFWLTRQNVATADPANVPGQPAYVVPTGEQEHNGYEINARFAPVPAISLEVGYGYVDARVTKVINPALGQGVGQPIDLNPSHTYSASGSYTVQDGPAAGLRLGLGVRAISDRPAPRFGIRYEGYTLADAFASYPVNETVNVQLNVLNLFDERYRPDVGFANGTPGAGHRYGQPRTAYLTVRANF